jgi:hypothetical protein
LRWRKLKLKLSQANLAGVALEVVAEDSAEEEMVVALAAAVADSRRPIPA